MIDFELTEDHRALVQTMKEFGQKSRAFHQRMGRKTAISAWDSEKDGRTEPAQVLHSRTIRGRGFDYISLGLVCEELEAVDTFLRVVMSVHPDSIR